MSLAIQTVWLEQGAIADRMTAPEARQCIAAIKAHLHGARALLLELEEREGWRALGYSSWRACVVAEFGQSQAYLYRQLAAAKIERVVEPFSPIGEIPEGQLRPLAALDSPDEQRAVWDTAKETAPNGRVTAAHVVQVITTTRSYDGNEWYTPPEVIDAARAVMGGIDVDPATCAGAQRIVQAARWYTKDDDGLKHDWPGRVWLNPPYSTREVQQFTQRLIHQVEAGVTHQAVLLVNNATDTDWCQALLRRYPVCLTDGRVKFYRLDIDKKPQARQGQAFFYAGPHVDRFHEVFEQFGVVMTARKKEAHA